MALWQGFAISALVLAVLAVLSSAHPTHYPEVDAAVWRERVKSGEGMPPFQSYHIHVLFVSNQNDSIAEALSFRKTFMEHFKLTDDHPCNGTRHQGRLCMFSFDTESGTDDSPFITSEWGMFLPVEHFQTYVPWTMQNRGNNIVFVHPNSGMEKEDHVHWAVWQGAIWPLRPSALCTYCDN
eukprot:scpid85449/ scgid9844/ 